MLHCNMTVELTSQSLLDLEDVLANLQHARRTGDLGRLALLIYWEVRKWARWAHRDALAARATDLIAGQPHPNREAFLATVDEVIQELERIRMVEH